MSDFAAAKTVSPNMANRQRVLLPNVYAPPAALVLSAQVLVPASYKAVAVPAIKRVLLSSFLRTAVPLHAAAKAARVTLWADGAASIPFVDGIKAEQLVRTPASRGFRSGA